MPYRRFALIAIAALALATGCQPAPIADSSNATEQDPRGWFESNHLWYGDVGDPQIVTDGDTYYAFSSPTAGRYLPVTTSTNLTDWRVRPRYTTTPYPSIDNNTPDEIRNWNANLVDQWNNNDGLVAPAAWGLTERAGSWITKSYWAPGIAKINNTWYAYSAVRLNYTGDDPNGYGRFCLTVASAPNPTGPYRDLTGNTPLHCGADPSGSIDPEPFRDPRTGHWYLLWKSAGKVGAYPSTLKAQRINPATGFLDTRTPITTLLTTSQPWEGNTIEAPSMSYHDGRYYLFYAANSVVPGKNNLSSYATGYAICPYGPRAACTRPTTTPLLASRDEQQGPAGGSAFHDHDGNLRFAYSYFWYGEDTTRTPSPRRLAIVELASLDNGQLVVK